MLEGGGDGRACWVLCDKRARSLRFSGAFTEEYRLDVPNRRERAHYWTEVRTRRRFPCAVRYADEANVRCPTGNDGRIPKVRKEQNEHAEL